MLGRKETQGWHREKDDQAHESRSIAVFHKDWNSEEEGDIKLHSFASGSDRKFRLLSRKCEPHCFWYMKNKYPALTVFPAKSKQHTQRKPKWASQRTPG